MTIRQHLNAIEQSGFYSNFFNDETESDDSRVQTLMKAEISFAFPLLNDAGKAVLFLAWSAHRNHQRSTATSGSTTQAVSRDDALSLIGSEAETTRATLEEAVEDLVENERFSDAQVEFIATEMLGIEKPVEE